MYIQVAYVCTRYIKNPLIDGQGLLVCIYTRGLLLVTRGESDTS